MSDPEFTRIIDIRHIDSKPVELVASAEECRALAKRFALVSVDRLAATLTLSRDADAVTARGRLKAAIVQSCAVSAEDLPAKIDEALALRFVQEISGDPSEDDEIELSDADCDEIPYEGERIDLGEAIAQSLALAIDPFAVGPDAEKMRASGLLGEDKLSPFAALAALKKD
jgi:uncharacterized metal-binding protein YceD (DUF177 family)